MGYAYGFGYGHTYLGKKRRVSAVAAAVGGAALLVGEANGFATDFLYPVDASRVALKTSGSTLAYGVDAFYQNAGTSPKMVYDVAGVLGWSPHNLLAYSNGFSGGGWDPYGHTMANNVVGPFGGANTAWTFTMTAGSSGKALFFPITAGGTYRYSIYAKAGVLPWIAIDDGGQPGSGTGHGAFFNLSTGTVGAVNGHFSAASIQAVGNGWYRCSVITTGSGASYGLSFHTADDQITYWTAVGNETILISAAQAEKVSSTLSPYLPTTTAARVGLALDYDPVTHSARGLLCEPQATNLVQDSNGFFSNWDIGGGMTKAQNASGPMGANTATTLTMVAGTGSHWIYCNAPASGNYRFSIYAKAGTLNWIALSDAHGSPANNAYFNVSAGTIGTVAGVCSAASIENVGNGWFRCSVTVTGSLPFFSIEGHSADNQALAWAATGGETVLISAAQAETGTVATSYIPTPGGATVTRAGDWVQVTSASINYSATAGSWWLKVRYLYTNADPQFIRYSNAAQPLVPAGNSALIWALPDSLYSPNIGVPLMGNTVKIMSAFQAGDGAVTGNGVAPATAVFTGTALLTPGTYIGIGAAGVNLAPGYYQQIRYLPRRPSNSEMQVMTT